MSVEDGNNKAIGDLGLSLNFHNPSIQLNNKRGAGLNATSKVDITVSTSHPLLELVWCPSKGISIKNTNCDRIITEKEAASVWGLQPNHMTVSYAKSIGANLAGSENMVDDKNDASSLYPVKFGVDEVDAAGRVSGSIMMGQSVHCQGEVVKIAGSSPILGVINSGGLSTMPGTATSVAVHTQEGPSRQCNASTTFVDQEDGSLLKMPKTIADNSKKNEFSAENCVVAETSYDANPGALQFNSHLVDGRNQRKEVYLSKGKSKALSDGDFNDQLSDDNTSGSAGSCNSKMLVSSRNTKRSLDQQLMVKSKRLKQRTERDTDTFIRQSSSFMSWISNMVKGYPGCNQDDAPSSMLPNMISTHTEQEDCSHKPVDHDVRGVGFRNFFQSICCSNDRVRRRNIYLDYGSSKASGDVKHNSMVNVNALPLTVLRTSENIFRDNAESSEMCSQHIGSHPKQGIVLSSKFSMKEIKILPGTKNTISCNVSKSVEIGKSSKSVSSTDKEGAQATEYSEEENEAQPFGPKRDYLGSLWISRFRPKISQPAANVITSKLTVSKRVLRSSKIILSSGAVSSHSDGRNEFVKHEGLIGSEQVNVKDEKNLEVMASVFARRLDALKQVVPYDATLKPFSMAIFCLFCGARGHGIQACSEITESELEELHHLIKSYDSYKDPTCLCIKCFQHSHWAIECPQRPSGKSALGSNIDFYSNRRDKEGKCFLENNDHLIERLAPQRTSRGNIKPDAKSIQLQDSGKLNLVVADDRNSLYHAPCTQEGGESSSRPINKVSPSKKDVFDAVRRLRLSRSDFLRLVDSLNSPSHLRGFYLRVRLCDRKGRLGQKGYYVACIQNTATKRGLLDQARLETSVGVAIGSFTCLVESRYISNQDFGEDELMTWWTETGKYSHCQNPISLEKLEQKYRERQKLGF